MSVTASRAGKERYHLRLLVSYLLSIPQANTLIYKHSYSLMLGVPRITDNIQVPIFNGVAQKVILASDHCEIFTTLNKKQ